MTDVHGANPRTPRELLEAGRQIATKADISSDLSIQEIVQKIKDIFGFDIPNWEQLTANFAELRQAIDGTYTGTNPALLAIQGTIGVLRRLAAGIIEPWRLPLIPLSHIGEASPNLLENGSFDGPNPIEETEGWSLDTGVGRTSPGSARTYGNGTRRVLLSNVVLCTPDQKFDVGGYLTWSMLTGGGAGAFKLSVVAYDSTESVVEEKVIAKVDDPSAAQAWTGLLGQYTVPDNTVKIRVQVEVAATVTGGTINWDDLSVTKYGNLPQRMVAGLVAALGDLGSGIAAIVANVGDFFDRLTGKVGTTIADLQSWAAQLKTILSGGTVGSGIFPTLDNGLRGVVSGVQGFAQAILEKIVQAIRGIPVVGAGLADLFDDVAALRSTADTANATAITADTKAVTAQETAQETAQGVVDGWTGAGTSTGDVYDTMQAIKTAIQSGYTVQTITSSTTWLKPANLTEIIVIACGSGQNGGGWSFNSPGTGGIGGGFLVQQFDPASVPSSVSVTIGASNGAQTSFGSLMTTTLGKGGIGTGLAFSATASLPGNGGRGGWGYNSSGGTSAEAGEAGGSTPLANGGAGGAVGANGSPGQSVATTVPTKCGGAGGGGGGGRTGSGSSSGGAGGFPGAGGGGSGGSGGNGSGNTGGLGAAGVMWILTKTGA